MNVPKQEGINIPIKADIKMFYKVLLTLMNKFPPIRGMRERELDVLAEIMLQNYYNRETAINKRFILIFSKENRKEMRESLNMSEGSFNDYLSRLRKIGVLTKDNKLLSFLNIIPDNKYYLNIQFNVNG